MCPGCAATARETPYGRFGYLSRPDELGAVWTHGLAMLASPLMFGWLLLHHHFRSPALMVACVCWGLAQTSAYASSSTYHAWRLHPDWFRVRDPSLFRSYDQSAALSLIAGTFTPLSVAICAGRQAVVVLVTVWLGGAALATAAVLARRRTWSWKRPVEIAGFLAVVAAGLALMWTRLAVQPPRVWVPLLAGGLCYLIGLLPYCLHRMPFGHTTWHLCVMVANGTQGWAVLPLL